MTHRFADLVFTAPVREAQARRGTRARNERLQALGSPHEALGAGEAAFIQARESFYMATVSDAGWPYLQHRGGPAGFVRVLGPHELAFADFRGNLQYVSVGNLAANDRAALFFMDYAARRRLKLLGRVRVVEAVDADPALLEKVSLPAYAARVERVMCIAVEAFEWNCPQHIPRFYSEAEVQAIVEAVRGESPVGTEPQAG